MQIAEATALTALTCGRIRPPLSATAIITSGTPCPRASRAQSVDQRPVDQPADDRDDHEEPQPQPRQVRAGHPALLAELAMPGGQPGEEVDQVPEHHRAQPRPRAHHQREQEHAATARPQPRRAPPGPRRGARGGPTWYACCPTLMSVPSGRPGRGPLCRPAGAVAPPRQLACRPGLAAIGGRESPRPRPRTPPAPRPPHAAGPAGRRPRISPISARRARWPGPPPAGPPR